MDEKDGLLFQFLVLYVKAVVRNTAEVCYKDETEEGTWLNCPTVPWARQSVFQVYREMGARPIFVVSFECRILRFVVSFAFLSPS